MHRGFAAAAVALGMLGASPGFAEQEVARDVYARVAPSVLLVVTYGPDGKVIAQGTGFVIEGNLVVTNAHVVRGGTPSIATGVARVPCVITRIDDKNDLAVLRPSAVLDATPLRAANPNTPIGTRVFALGNPAGLERTITEGLYTGTRSFAHGVTLLQFSAPVSPGSSGGPVVDASGLVVGITVSSLGSGQNLNFAVPVDTLIQLLARPEAASAPAAARPLAAASAASTQPAATPVTTAAAVDQFQATLAQRLAIRLSRDTTPTWLELRKRERDLLAAAINAARTDDELRSVHVAAREGHDDIALDAAALALKRAQRPDEWHHFGIAASAYDFSRVVDDARKTELLRQAQAAIRQAIQLKASGKAWLLTGQIHGALREWPSSKSALALAMTVGVDAEDRLTAISALATAARGLNDEAEALKWFAELERAGGVLPPDAYAHALFLSDRGRAAEAAVWFERLAANPTADTPAPAHLLWYMAAYDHWRVVAADRALAAAKTALGVMPPDAPARDRAQAHALIAAILLTRGDPMAEEAGRQAVQIDPLFAGGHIQLARALNVARRAVEAEPIAREAVELTGGNDSEAHFALGTSLFFQQRWQEAHASYLRAATLNRADAHAAFNTDLALENLGRPREALVWYEETLKRNPNIPERDQVLAAIGRLKAKG